MLLMSKIQLAYLWGFSNRFPGIRHLELLSFVHFVNTVIPAVFHTIYRVLEGIYRFQRFISLFGSHQVFSMQEFSWLSLYGFYHVLRLAVFPFTHRFW